MTNDRAIELLERQRSAIASLKKRGTSYNPQYQKWHRATKLAIQHIFQNSVTHIHDFSTIVFGSFDIHTAHVTYAEGLAFAEGLLTSFIDEINDYGLKQPTLPPTVRRAPEQMVELICRRFHTVAKQLTERRDNRSPIEIKDEYDVQYLLHALLRLHFDDVRAEEPAPSMAGASSRMDFVLKAEQVVVEAKKMRPSLTAKILGEELLTDIARYAAHPDCKLLFCFIYDPDGLVSNPRGIEKDLEKTPASMRVRVMIEPQ